MQFEFTWKELEKTIYKIVYENEKQEMWDWINKKLKNKEISFPFCRIINKV